MILTLEEAAKSGKPFIQIETLEHYKCRETMPRKLGIGDYFQLATAPGYPVCVRTSFGCFMPLDWCDKDAGYLLYEGDEWANVLLKGAL